MRKPITTALSGPAAGALGSAVIAEVAGFPDLVTLDAGGTSTDLCLIEGAKPKITNGGAGRRVSRCASRCSTSRPSAPAAARSPGFRVKESCKVGPRSAGAVPGPMCYPNGGNEPTITDANLVLGRHSAGADRRRHQARCRARARRVESAGRAAARQSQRRAARPRHHRDRQLGPGQCHPADDHPARHRSGRFRAAVVRRLRAGAVGGGDGIDGHEDDCIVPPNPGNLSAFGLLAVDWRTDHIVTKVMHEEAIDLAAVAAHLRGTRSGRRQRR